MQDLTCAKCSKLSSKILALECQHSLCLLCASQALERCKRSDRKRQGEIQCEICGSISVIHKSALAQLLPSENKKSRYRAEQQMRQQNPLLPKQTQSMLFCLNCERICFTIDDYLSGMHSGHQVKNVKRSGSLLKELLGQINQKVKQRIEMATNESNKLIERKRDLVENFGYTKKTLKQHFEKIRNLLDDKQEQMINLVEELMVNLFSQVDSSIIETKNYLSKFESIHQQINHNLSIPNTVKAFNYYSDRKQEILRQISFSIQGLSRQTLNSAQCLNMNTGILHDCYQSIKRMKLSFTEAALVYQSREGLLDDFFEAKKNEVFNQTIKKQFKEYKNVTLNTVKSLDQLRPQPNTNIIKSRNKGVEQRLRQLQILISKPNQTNYKHKRFN